MTDKLTEKQKAAIAKSAVAYAAGVVEYDSFQDYVFPPAVHRWIDGDESNRPALADAYLVLINDRLIAHIKAFRP